MAKFEIQEGNLLDLAADCGLATPKLRRRLNDIAAQKASITAQLSAAEVDLSNGS